MIAGKLMGIPSTLARESMKGLSRVLLSIKNVQQKSLRIGKNLI